MAASNANSASPPPFTRARLRDLSECARRYWLRNIAQIPWPAAPLPPAVEKAVERGRQFHQLMHRHFLNMELPALPPSLRTWWAAWQRDPLPLPPGRLWPEITLSVPLAGERLLARFDLLVLADDGSALIVDWKTESRPRKRAELAADIQTQLYPFILAEGGHTLAPRPAPIEFGQVVMVYWQANAPADPLCFPYSADQRQANRKQLEELIGKAQVLKPANQPPLIDDLSICLRCSYRSYCGRGEPEPPDDAEPDLDEFALPRPDLEPDR